MLGGLFIGTTLLMPRGIIGTYNNWRSKRSDVLAEAAKNASASAAKEDGSVPAGSTSAAE